MGMNIYIYGHDRYLHILASKVTFIRETERDRDRQSQGGGGSQTITGFALLKIEEGRKWTRRLKLKKEGRRG